MLYFASLDVYWRNYNGTIPSDGVSGGVDKYGIPTYVGQAFLSYHDLAVPVNLYQTEIFVETPNHGIHQISGNLRVKFTNRLSVSIFSSDPLQRTQGPFELGDAYTG